MDLEKIDPQAHYPLSQVRRLFRNDKGDPIDRGSLARRCQRNGITPHVERGNGHRRRYLTGEQVIRLCQLYFRSPEPREVETPAARKRRVEAAREQLRRATSRRRLTT